MPLNKAQIFPFKGHSADAVRESIARIWESCLPTRKIVTKSPYFIPDLNKPIVKSQKKVILKFL